MTIEALISRLETLAEAAPGSIVMLRRGNGDWFDEIEEVRICGINAERDGLDCVPGQIGAGGTKEVVVIH